MQRLTVAIVGGGASGSIVAHELLRHAAADHTPLHIWLIDEHGRQCAGQAYSTDHELHLLNAPAGKMSALADEPGHLVSWARCAAAVPDEVGPASFLPRRAYRRYLQETLAASERAAAPASQLTRLQAAVTSIRTRPGQRGAWLETGGGWLHADVAVLATGHAAAVVPFEAPDVARVIADPWQPGGLDRLDSEPAGAGGPRRVVVAGTGLTMVDVAIAVTSRFPGCTVHAVSRHGLLPRTHPGGFPSQPGLLWLPPACQALGPVSLGELAGQIRRAISASGGDWHSVLEALRPHAPSLWQRMPDRDKRVFLSRLERYWQVHRHLMPPATATRISDLRQAGRLVIHRGRIHGARRSARGLVVDALTAAGPIELAAGWLINATGGTSDITVGPSPLLRQLFATGLARPDSLRLGIDADPAGAVISSAGRGSDFLYALGPPLRGTRYETTAIPEIRSQAAGIAAQIASRVPGTAPAAVV